MNLQLDGIGADPEFFLKKNDEFYPVVGLLGGTKMEPERVTGLGIYNAYLEDNVMPEYNISPVKNADDFVNEISTMIDLIMDKLGDEYTADFSPAARFKSEYLQTKQACVFGCEPDHNAYTLDIQHVEAEDAGTLRTAGGHIHISWEDASGDFDEAATVARAFDLFVTAPMMLIEPDNERRQLYGKAGSFRTKFYGVECRQLSAFWQSSEALQRFVYNQTVKAIEFVNSNEDIRDNESALCRTIQDAIDSKLMGEVAKLVQTYEVANLVGYDVEVTV